MSIPKKIAKDEAVRRGESDEYQIFNYLTKDDSPGISVAVSVLHGRIPETKNVVSDRVYYFLDADAQLIFDDGTEIHVEAGDLVRIPRDTPYSVTGEFRAVLINTPAFDIANERES